MQKLCFFPLVAKEKLSRFCVLPGVSVRRPQGVHTARDPFKPATEPWKADRHHSAAYCEVEQPAKSKKNSFKLPLGCGFQLQKKLQFHQCSECKVFPPEKQYPTMNPVSVSAVGNFDILRDCSCNLRQFFYLCPKIMIIRSKP